MENQLINPYEPPQVVQGAVTSGPIAFSATMTAYDLRRALMSHGAFVFFCVAEFLWVALCSLALLGILTRSLNSGVNPVAVRLIFLMLFFGFLLSLPLFSIWNTGKRYAYLFPDATGYSEGWVDSDWFFIRSANSEGLLEFKNATLLKIRQGYLIYSNDCARLAKIIVPLNAFENPAAVSEIVRQWQSKIPKVKMSSLDMRGHEPVELPVDESLPADAICFNGPIMSDDLMQATLKSTIAKIRWAFLGLTCILLLLIVLLLRSRIQLLSVPLMVVIGWLWTRYFRNVRPLSRPNQILRHFAGYVSDSCLRMHSALGSGRIGWQRVEGAKLFGDTLVLLVNPRISYNTYLHRRQFPSDEAWQATLSLVERKITLTRV